MKTTCLLDLFLTHSGVNARCRFWRLTFALKFIWSISGASIQPWFPFSKYPSLYITGVPTPTLFHWRFKIVWVKPHPWCVVCKKIILPLEKVWVTPHTHNIWHVRFPLWQNGFAHSQGMQQWMFHLWCMGVLTPMTYSQVWYNFAICLLLSLLTQTCHFGWTHVMSLSDKFHGRCKKIQQAVNIHMNVWVISQPRRSAKVILP